MSLTPESVVQRNPQVVGRALAPGEGGVLLHLSTAAYHRVNPVGLAIWDLLETPRRVSDVVAGVRDSVANAPDSIDGDVTAFLQSAIDRDLVLQQD